jgi:multidrug efflux pump subunit AcrB
MLLLPMRVALVAASTIPITIFMSLALFYAFGIELNTVTLVALIATLGMIVDNSIVIIDSYLELISSGMSRWHASISSATHFFKSIFSATMAISITFFPFLATLTGMTRDFINSFPWAMTLVLLISLLVAELLVPFMQFYFIRKPMEQKVGKDGKKPFSFLDLLQRSYDKLIDLCFAWPKTVMALAVLSVGLGLYLMTLLPQQLLPTAERNQFAVEIYMPTGTSLDKTTLVADSLEHILRRDDRVVSVASFKGCASPRFQSSYAPQMGGPNFAQFIVNTTGNDATEALLNEYAPQYRQAFPEAVVRFKQLGYSEAVNPIEVRLSGDDLDLLKAEADHVVSLLRTMPEINLVRTDYNEPLAALHVQLDEDRANRLGISNAPLETTLALRYGSGFNVGTVWEGNYDIPVVLKSTRADYATVGNLQDEQIPVAGGITQVPLRQVAEVVPSWEYGKIVRRNGVRTVSVIAEMERRYNAMRATDRVKELLAESPVDERVSVEYGGELAENDEQMPHIAAALGIAVVIIFFILVWHFKRIATAVMMLCSLTLCFLGTALGVLIQGVDFSMTATLGIVSLMGILVRNGIIMIDYAEELRTEEHLLTREAIYHSAKRRMRPIFLTSAAASMGVLPMVLGGSGLWMPMGTVIFWGTLITMFFILTVIPIAYMMTLRGSTKRRAAREELEKQ